MAKEPTRPKAAPKKKRSMMSPENEGKCPTPKEKPHSWRNPKYHPDMCEMIQEWYQEGMADAQIAHRLDICKETFYEWVRTRPDFQAAVTRGKTASEEWWSKLGQDMSKGAVKGSEKIWLITMKNRFKYTDTVQLEDCDHFGLNRTIKDLKVLVELYKSREKEY